MRRPKPGLDWIALAALLLVTAAIVYHETRGTTLWSDEWSYALDRRGGDLATVLRPHNEHFTLVPVAIYKLLFATAGLDDYRPYRALIIAAHALCAVLLFAYARPRVGGTLGLLAAVMLLLLGPAWQNILWPFQIGMLLSLASGIGALRALERGDRRGDVGAAVLTGVSLASSGIGVPIALGLAAELLWARRRLTRLWVVAVPLAGYATWWLAYSPGELVRHRLVLLPGFVADAAASAVSALAGFAAPLGTAQDTLAWGRPLTVAAAVLIAWRLSRLRPLTPRVLGLLTMLLSFWMLTALSRAGTFVRPDEGRYLYVGGLLLLLLIVELAQGVVISRSARALLAAAVGLAVLANFGDLRDGGRTLRATADATRASLGALELAREVVAPGTVAQGVPGYPLILVDAGAYFSAAAAFGTPAMSPAELAAASEEARAVADAELRNVHRVALLPGGAATGGGPPPVERVTGGTVSERGSCVTFQPASAGLPEPSPGVELTLPAAGMTLTATSGSAAVSVRRFAQAFPSEPLGVIAPSGSATLRIAPDRAQQPWHVRVASRGRLVACSLRD